MTVVSQNNLRLEDYVPHRKPMLLLDKAVSFDDESAVAQVIINEASRFYDSYFQGVPSWVGIEYMAQTMAIWTGARRLKDGKPVALAYLMGGSEYNSKIDAFYAGRAYNIFSKVLVNDEKIASFGCRIEDDGSKEAVVEARLSAYLPEDDGSLPQLG